MRTDSSSTLRTVFWGAVWRLLRCPFLFLSMILIPRAMGVTTYGRFAFFVSVELACEAFTGLGYLQIFGRFLPEFGRKRCDDAAHFLHGLLFYGMLGALLVFFGATLVLFFFRPPGFEPGWLLILGAAVLLGKFQDTLFFFLYGKNEIGRFSVRDVMRTAFKLVFVLLLFRSFRLQGALWGLVLTHLALAIVGMWWTRPYLFRTPYRRIPFSEFKSYLLFGVTFYLPTLLLGVLQQIGNIQIQTLTHSPVQVSYFDVANQVLLVGGTLLGLIITMLVPSLTALHISDRRESVGEWQGIVLSYCTAAAFLALNTLVLVGKLVITRLIAREFENAYGVAVVVAIALFPLLLSRVGSNLAILRKEPRVYAISVLAGVVTIVGVGFALIPRLGAGGAAWATVSAHVVMAALFCMVYRKEFTDILKRFAVTVVAGSVAVPFYLRQWSPYSALGALLATSLLYLLVLLALGMVRIEHLRKLAEALRLSPGKTEE